MVRQGKYTKPTTHIRRIKRRIKHRYAEFKKISLKKKILFISAPIIGFLIIAPTVTYIVLANDIADKERLMNRNNTGIVLTDRSDRVFYSVGKAEQRDIVPLSKISDITEKALVATEDKDFYSHSGFSVTSIIRAAITGVGGGSTLTQQLVKNTLLNEDRNFLRKYLELNMSIAVEQRYTKDEILEMYLNSVYYGENAFGIDDAARTYFDTTPDKLTLAQSAMLIGLLPAPSAYSPISGNPQYAKERQETVLNRMVANGYITNAEKEDALNVKLIYNKKTNSADGEARHFRDMVIEELSEKYGYEKVMRSGYQVKTTLDLGMQRVVEKQVKQHLPYIKSRGGSNAGAIIIDPKNGEIRALVGSADWNNKKWGKVNIVMSARQPGSSFKPLYYAEALSQGVITPATILEDKRTDFGGGYIPQNADRRFRGNISVRNAISQSLNIPSIEVMQRLGINKSIEAVRRMGVTTVDQNKEYGLSLALGAAEARLIDMTNVYAGFANGGRQYEPIRVLQINDKFDNRIYTTERKPAKNIISAEGAFLISSILSDATARAPMFGSALNIPGKTAAVKTGTTDDNRDAIAIGYTPSIAMGVWVGNNDNTKMYSGGSDMAAPIWRNSLSNILAKKTNEQFVIPSGIVQKDTCRSNGGIAPTSGVNTYSEYFRSGALPTERCEAKQLVNIKVCTIKTKEVVEINEDDFNDKTQSKDLEDCTSETVEVCLLADNTIVLIKKDEYDKDIHSKDTTGCESPGETLDPNAVSPNESEDIIQPPSQSRHKNTSPVRGNYANTVS